MTPDRVGVVLPCRDEVGTLADAITSARRQEPAPALVVVVDNGSTDGSLAVAHVLADVVLERPGLTVGAVRNAGAAVAAAAGVTVLAFLDADCQAGPGWLAAGLAGLREHDLVGARTEAPEGDRLVARRWAAIERALMRPGAVPWSQHLLIRAELFERIGGFDEQRPTGEDVDLGLRVVASGGSVGLVDGMRVVHRGFAPSVLAFVRRERWHASSPGWFLATSSRGRAVIVVAPVWTAVGLAAMALRRPRLRALWAASGAAGLVALGRRLGSGRYAGVDTGLLWLWAMTRATRLVRGLRST